MMLDVINEGKCPEFEDVEARIQTAFASLWSAAQLELLQNRNAVLEVLQRFELSLGEAQQCLDSPTATAALLVISEAKERISNNTPVSILSVFELFNKLTSGLFLLSTNDLQNFTVDIDIDPLVARVPWGRATKQNKLISEALKESGYECHLTYQRMMSE